jgi:hypothetical protein
VLAGEDVNQLFAGAIGRTDFGPFLRDFFRGTEATLAEVLRRELVQV